MLINAFIQGALFALFAYFALRFCFKPAIKGRLILFFLKKGDFTEQMVQEAYRFIDSPEVQGKIAALFRNHLKETFLQIKAKVPFAASFLSSDFVRKIESEAEEAILAVVPSLKSSIQGELEKRLTEEALLKLLSSQKSFPKEREIWLGTLASFLTGFLFSLASGIIASMLAP